MREPSLHAKEHLAEPEMGCGVGAQQTGGSASRGYAVNGVAMREAQRTMGNGIAEEGSEGQNDSSAGSSTPSGDSASHMYFDLRPFMDQAPTIVRCALTSVSYDRDIA